ncbi:hypothetical protein CPLU01_02507 [Colletotrichum plurivorum]|uniref:Actin-like ATPase domain-containing protein n=1 Tax=Colletotrichum plurivorum TaxID=2175906 RepID=A0A8H6KW44_9PEZI|nr:hypothetical protein CPLU01_02507 [Colletotrichum plurivorum]
MPSTKSVKKAGAAKKLPPINRRRSIRVKSIELGDPVSPGTDESSADLSEDLATSLNLGSSDEVSPDRRSVESTVHVATDFPRKPAWHKSSHKAPKHETQITTPTKPTRKDGSKASSGQTIGHKRAGSDLGVPAKRKRDSPLTHAYLGIDNGSSALRATLIVKGGIKDEFIDVHDPDFIPLERNGPRFDFPSAINPNLNLVGHDAIRSGKWVNVKFLFYELVRMMNISNPEVSESVKNKIDKTFRDDDCVATGTDRDSLIAGTVLGLIVQYFQNVERATASTCAKSHKFGLYYDSIVVTIPSSWNEPFQDVYTSILMKAFPHIKSSGIVFVHESEAIGHYLMSEHVVTGLRQIEETAEAPYAVMVVDFGGHTVNGTTIFLNWGGDQSKDPAFYTRPAWGAPGGAEIYAQVIEEAILSDPEIVSHPNRDEHVRQLMASFKQKQRGLRGEPFVLNSDFGNWYVSDASVAASLHDRAFRAPLDLVRKKIRNAAKKSSFVTVVILTGGSYLNDAAREDTIEEVKRHENQNWRHVALHEEVHDTVIPMLVARGAALALANVITVSEFLEAGAAFALRSTSVKDFAHFPHILLRGDASTKVTVKVETDAELYISCDPLHDPREVEGHGRVNAHNTYDFLDLGIRREGRYSYEMKYVCRQGKDTMRLIEETLGRGSAILRKRM